MTETRIDRDRDRDRELDRGLDLDLAEELIALHGRFRRALLAAKTDEITPTQSAVLGRLVRDGTQSTADLARAEGVRPQSMGQTVAGLVEQGLVVRESDPDDGRRAVVRLTDAGRRTREGSRATRARLIAERLSALPSEDRAVLERALAVIDDLVGP
ncbi:MarR family winged helix-turn-helix transcriptional regulator [Curtobacterium sp. RRHDQ10]|uniref:MarR family winged helix-turn-helix transcriptional regulator n=1 Tax=Curtobacterium phyllosphaerae TaxID=3413379 RepID=UPI003BEFE247